MIWNYNECKFWVRIIKSQMNLEYGKAHTEEYGYLNMGVYRSTEEFNNLYKQHTYMMLEAELTVVQGHCMNTP